MQRNEFIEILKGLLITLVCIGHANQFIIHQNMNFWQDPLFKTIYMFHMPLFMAVAGFLSHRGITTRQAVIYIYHRSFTYLVPIFIWAIMWQCLRMVITGQVDFFSKDIFSEISNLWFIWALLGSLILTTIAQATGKLRFFVIFLLFAIVLVLPNQSIIYLFQYTFPFFIAGFYLANFDFSCKLIKLNHLRLITFGLAIMTLVCFTYWEKDTYIYVSKMFITFSNLNNIIFRWFSGCIVSALFVIIVWSNYSRMIPCHIKELLIRSGRNSIYIYILQTYLFEIISHLLDRLPQQVILHQHPLVDALLSIIAGIIITYICLHAGEIIAKYKYFDRFLFGKWTSRKT